MKEHFISLNWDFAGFSASFLCAIHCMALPIMLIFFPVAGLEALENPIIEFSVIGVSFVIASWALSHGYFKHHHRWQPFALVVAGFLLIFGGHAMHFHSHSIQHMLAGFGGLIVAAAHVVNWRMSKNCADCHH